MKNSCVLLLGLLLATGHAQAQVDKLWVTSVYPDDWPYYVPYPPYQAYPTPIITLQASGDASPYALQDRLTSVVYSGNNITANFYFDLPAPGTAATGSWYKDFGGPSSLGTYTYTAIANFAPDIGLAPESLSLQFTVAWPTIKGDFNGDGVVNDADYTVWADNSVMRVWPPFNEPCFNDADYTLWADNFGKTTPATPEPASLSLLGLGLLGLLRRNNRRAHG